jgi:hypothetical protein
MARCTRAELATWIAFWIVKGEHEQQAVEQARKEAEAKAATKGR